uniref:Uncharacterized protein n=1 Tax=Zeugodacus cucurbitae TaxID=28588 RepID=A0A0A1WNI5_ZEUCU
MLPICNDDLFNPTFTDLCVASTTHKNPTTDAGYRRDLPLHNETDSDCERNVSCFGAVSHRKHGRRGHGRRHVRSKSFTNSTSSQQRHHQRVGGGSGVMRRSSSADLLLRLSPVTTPKQECTSSTGNRQPHPKHEELIFLI